MKQETITAAAAARRELETRIGHAFARPELLDLALTHSSWANEAGGDHNERLEFLGDAVLELCVSAWLYHRFPGVREGQLTRLRSGLVSTASLAERARHIGLDGLLRLGRGEEEQGGRRRDTVLSDALEAVLAAVYEDGGFAAARGAVERIFDGRWPQGVPAVSVKDCKTLLQEATQRLFGQTPAYVRAGSSGPEHAKVFEVVLTLPDGAEFRASGPSCRKAEQEAARRALAALGCAGC